MVTCGGRYDNKLWIFFLVSLLLGESVVKGHPCYRLSVIKNNKKAPFLGFILGFCEIHHVLDDHCCMTM